MGKINWLPLKAALALFEPYNRTITRHGLFQLGTKYGWVKKDIDGYHWLYNSEKIIEYLESEQIAFEKIQKGGYVRFDVNNFAKKYNISISKAYIIMSEFYFDEVKYKGKIYVKETT